MVDLSKAISHTICHVWVSHLVSFFLMNVVIAVTCCRHAGDQLIQH